MSSIHPILSRKLWVTILGILVAGLSHQYPAQQAAIVAIAGMVSTYVLGQAYVDAQPSNVTQSARVPGAGAQPLQPSPAPPSSASPAVPAP